MPLRVSNLLKLGPKFSLPPIPNNSLSLSIKCSLEKLVQNLRWKSHFQSKNESTADSTPLSSHPFDKPAYLAPKPPLDVDASFVGLKNSLFSVIKSNFPFYKSVHNAANHSYQITKSLSKNSNLVVVKSDKTNRLAVANPASFESRTLGLLSDPSAYSPILNPKISKIEAHSNKLIGLLSGKCPFLKNLKSRYTGPAKFFTLIKDHKPTSDSGFPLRPIASVRNTPIEKLDWFLNRILSQLIKFVPSHLSSSDELLSLLKNSAATLPANSHFISLDVVSLYPSIPISEGIEVVLDFFDKFKDKINTFGLDRDDINTLLCHVLNNYVISFNDKFFLQIKGVAMGSHIGPTFAIIFMNSIESSAIQSLPSELRPKIFKRYIDDCLLGPYPFDKNIHSSILQSFNSINSSIQFTLESVEPSSWLPFLDLKFRNNNSVLEFSPFSKPFHSGICLNFHSHHPPHVKSNFVRNQFISIRNHSSSLAIAEKASSDFTSKLISNGYPLSFIESCKSKSYLSHNSSASN